MSQKDPLHRIKSGAWARGMSLAKLTVSAGARVASHAVGNVFASEDGRVERTKKMLQEQFTVLSAELGQLKGSVMKAGQMLSMYGEHFLPPEANALLKSLQSQSPPMHWDAIEAVLHAQLSPEALGSVDIDHTPLAAASLGQVHRARRKSDGLQLAIKVQYPGVRDAIESDMKSLRRVLSVSRLLPRELSTDELFAEVKSMLEQEADYVQERVQTEAFGRDLADDPRYIVPRPIPELCTSRILTTTFEAGVAVDGPEVLALPQERRNALGATALDLYMRELWQLGRVQTDPHFGNYRVRLGEDGAPDRLVVLDFGAVRTVPPTFLAGYREMVVGACQRDPELIIRGCTTIGLLRPEDDEERKSLFVQLCQLIIEPFALPGTSDVPRNLMDVDGSYDWGNSDLPKRVARKGTEAVMAMRLRTPPRESVFLDRKLGGVFVFLSVLKVRLNGRALLARYLPV